MSDKDKKQRPAAGRGGAHGGRTHTPSDDSRGAGLTAKDRQDGMARKGRNTDGTGL